MTGGFRIQPLAGADGVTGDDVLALWAREGVVRGDEAVRRLDEVLLVATDPAGELAGVASTFLRHSDHLDLDLWNFRTFVAVAHRNSALAIAFVNAAREHLEARFVDGTDRRGVGMLVVVQHRGLQDHLPEAVWRRTGMAFVGIDSRGDHVRVRYFPGAMVPVP